MLAKLKDLERGLMPVPLTHHKSHTDYRRIERVSSRWKPFSICLNMTEVRFAQTCSSSRHIIEISDTSIVTSVPQHAMKVHGGVELRLHIFLTSAQHKCKESDSRPSRSTSEAEAPYSDHVADGVGTTACLIAVGRTNLPGTCVELRFLLTSQ